MSDDIKHPASKFLKWLGELHDGPPHNVVMISPSVQKEQNVEQEEDDNDVIMLVRVAPGITWRVFRGGKR